MANSDRPRGFMPHGQILQTVVLQAGSDVVANEFVSLADDGQVDSSAAGADILGLCLNKAASGESVLVSCYPEQIYVGQTSASDVNAQTDIGNLVNILDTAQNTTYDVARMEVDSTTIGTGSGGQLVLLGIEEREGNAFGANVDVRVKINEHQAFGTDDFAGI